MRTVAAVIGGIVAWVVVATLGNFALRALLPSHAGVERAMTFTFDMQTGRLVVGAIAPLAAGLVAAWVARGAGAREAWIVPRPAGEEARDAALLPSDLGA